MGGKGSFLGKADTNMSHNQKKSQGTWQYRQLNQLDSPLKEGGNGHKSVHYFTKQSNYG